MINELTNTIEGKLYAVDTTRQQVAVYVANGENGFRPAWQTVSRQHIDEVMDEMRAFLMYKDSTIYFYNASQQMASCAEYLAVREAAARMLAQQREAVSQ